MWNIGFLIATSVDLWKPYTDAFEAQLKSHLKTGEDFKIEYRATGGLQKPYMEIAKDFAGRTLPIDIIVTGGTGAVLACKKATSKIPIVFATAGTQLTPGW
jgi:putative ABC transport system substrate-binding protein